ncbi:MAG: glycosyltransferase [Bacteroidia bacterium]
MGSSPKKIVIIGPAYPLRGGLASYNQLLAKQFSKEGHSVKIITFSLQYPRIFFPGKTQYSTDKAPEGIDIEVSLNSVNPFNWWRLGRRLRKEAPDLVIFRYWIPFMGPSLGVIGRIVSKNNHSRIVAITDNVIPHEKRFFDRAATRFFLKSCHGFVCMSRSVMEDLKAFNLNKPTLFNPHPMYEDFGPIESKKEARKALGLPEEGRLLLFFGFIRKYKGLDLMLKTMAQHGIRDLGVKLIIAGEYYESAKPYEDLIKELGLQEAIIPHQRFIPDSEVHHYFNACDIVVQTYKAATQSGVTQIAYFYNKPMLVTNVGGLAELVPHKEVGYVCEKNEKEIADNILDFYENNREEQMAEQVRIQRSKFSWANMSQTLFKSAGLD